MKQDKIALGIRATAVIYMTGGIVFIHTQPVLLQYSRELQSRESALTRKIEETQHFLPMIREPFVSQYQDSVSSWESELEEVYSGMNALREREEKMYKKPFYSWAAFFMED